ncbi:MAG: 3-dehydroquinate synthase [Eubacterium sp.]|nr:3-dehydroquinate synthase [Eubacterium sp.]
MARELPVHYEGNTIYNIQIESGFNKLILGLKKLNYDSTIKICIISDSNVSPLYAKELEEKLKENYFNIFLFVFSAGEPQKNLNTVQHLYEYLVENHFERRDLLLALGGGVVGDLTGFTAATYLRGIDFIQIPTSLLSQVDSSIGGKTGVDFLKYKNMVGAFYMPKLVYINLSVLKTLPEKEFISGMGEIIKHGLIKNKEYFRWLSENREHILARNMDALEHMIYESCLIKRAIVEKDPKEKGERALLNFGHTIGHAVEMKTDFVLLHGECVSLGIVSALYLSYRLGHISQEEFENTVLLLNAYHLPTKLDISCRDAGEISAKEILTVSKSDKKMEAGTVKFVLLKSIGNAVIDRNIDDDQLLEAIEVLFR